jgi:putative CocE/NonD family hydrolase
MWLKRLHQLPFFLEPWLRHQRRDGYWRHGSVCEDYAAIACPVYAVGGWTDGYTNAIPRLLQGLTVPRKGLIGPWAHAYPHIAKPGPQVGFLQEMLRWWDHWLKDIDDGLMSEPMLRAWMIDGAHPARHHETLPGYWTSATEWPPTARATLPFFLTDAGLREDRAGSLSPRAVCTPQTVGKQAGQWCPFGRGDDEAGDQREDDRQSVVFDSQVLGQEVQVLGAPVAEFEVESDRPVATLVARLCDVHPSGESLRVSFAVLNLTHRDGHAQPAALEPGRRYRVRMQLNDAGAVFPAGHRIRLALSTTYWPMLWPAPQKATVTIHQGRLDLPMRTPGTEGLRPMPPPHTSPPEPTTVVRPGTVRIERLGLELSTQGKYEFSLEHDDPLSATALMHRTQAIRRGSWQVEIETRMRWTCSRDSFFLEAGLRACEGAEEIVQRTWKCTVARDLV